MVAGIPCTASNNPRALHDLDLFDYAAGEVMIDTNEKTVITSRVCSNGVVFYPLDEV